MEIRVKMKTKILITYSNETRSSTLQKKTEA